MNIRYPIYEGVYRILTFLFSLVNDKADSQSYLRMEITRIRSEQSPFLDLQQEHHPVGQISLKGRSQPTAIDKAVTVCHRRPVRKQGGSPVDRLETAQCRESDT